MIKALPMPRRALAEAIGTAFLLAAIIGSGVAAQRLTADIGLQLLINALATAGTLVALITVLGPISGAHLNPAITVAAWRLGELPGRAVPAYLAAQLGGACVGAIAANAMFGLAVFGPATTARGGPGLWLGEVVATVGLAVVAFGAGRTRALLAPIAVGAYVAAAIFFTSSTSFANPAVTLARALTDSFAGIAPASVPAFLVAQLVGLTIATALVAALFGTVADTA